MKSPSPAAPTAGADAGKKKSKGGKGKKSSATVEPSPPSTAAPVVSDVVDEPKGAEGGREEGEGGGKKTRKGEKVSGWIGSRVLALAPTML